MKHKWTLVGPPYNKSRQWNLESWEKHTHTHEMRYRQGCPTVRPKSMIVFGDISLDLTDGIGLLLHSKKMFSSSLRLFLLFQAI